MSQTSKRDRISVIGAGCQLPGASSLEELWSLLVEEQCLIRQEPPNRWAIDPFLRKGPKKAGFAYTFAGGYLDNPFLFDPAPFGLSPREAEQIDPQQRLLLETVWRAFEQAGLPITKLKGTPVGVYVGASLVDYQSAASHDMSAIGSHFMTGNSLSILANRISYIFNFTGPSATFDAACASSFVALYHAVQALRAGEIDYAIVAGVNLMFSPLPFVGFCQAGMLSPTGQSQPFSENANGYVRSEGCVALILRRSDDASRDRQSALTKIIDVQTNSDGRKTGISLPSAAGQKSLIERIYQTNTIDPNDLQFVEAHGTGTPVGDPIEAHAIGTSLGQRRQTPLTIGSIKSNLGHLEAASGLAGFLKASLALQQGFYPATLNADIPNSNIPLAELNISLAQNGKALDPHKPLIAGICNYGFGGVNAHVIIENPSFNETNAIIKSGPSKGRLSSLSKAETSPIEHQKTQIEDCETHAIIGNDTTNNNEIDRTFYLLLSAASEPSLRARATQVAELIKKGSSPHHLAALFGHTDNILSSRLIVPLADDKALLSVLDQFSKNGQVQAPGIQYRFEPSKAAQKPKLAFVFSGNGSHYTAMGQLAFERNILFRRAIQRFDQAYLRYSGWSIAKRIAAGLSDEELQDTRIVQPAICAIQIGLVETLNAYGIKPDCVIGHSFGEVAAAYAAGILGLDQLAKLIFERSQSQHQVVGSGSMAVVAMNHSDLNTQLENSRFPSIAIAAINGERSTTISGSNEDISEFKDFLQEQRIPCVKLDIRYPFHSSMLDPYESSFLKSFGSVSTQDQSSTFYSTVKGTKASHASLDAAYWWANIRQPVLFSPTLHQLIEEECPTHIIEIGPRSILQSSIKEALKQSAVQSNYISTLEEDQHADHDPALQFIGRFLLSLPAETLHQNADLFFGKLNSNDVRLPPYPFEKSEFILPSHPYVTLYGAVAHNDPVHPLLGRRVTDRGWEWQAMIGPSNCDDFKDHCVNGAVILPASGFIEICFAALKNAFPNDKYSIETLDILRPLVLDQDYRVITCLNTRNHEIEISGQSLQADREALHFARARFRRVEITNEDRTHSAYANKGTTDSLTSIHFTADEVYERAQSLGLDYGPAFKRVEKGHRDSQFGYAELAPPIGNDQFFINPMSVDAGFHGLLLDLSSQNTLGQTFLPIRFSGLRLLRERAEIRTIWSNVLARRRLTSAATLLYCDSDGKAVLTIEEAVFRCVDIAPRIQSEPFSYSWLPLLGAESSTSLSIHSKSDQIVSIALKKGQSQTFIRLYHLLLMRIMANELQSNATLWGTLPPSAGDGILSVGSALLSQSPFSTVSDSLSTDDVIVSDAPITESIAAINEENIIQLILKLCPQAATDLQAAARFKSLLKDRASLSGMSPEILAHDERGPGHLIRSYIDEIIRTAGEKFIAKYGCDYSLMLDLRGLSVSQATLNYWYDDAKRRGTLIHLIRNENELNQHKIIVSAPNSIETKHWAYIEFSHCFCSLEPANEALEPQVTVQAQLNLDDVINYFLAVLEARPVHHQSGPISAPTSKQRRFATIKGPVGTMTLSIVHKAKSKNKSISKDERKVLSLPAADVPNASQLPDFDSRNSLFSLSINADETALQAFQKRLAETIPLEIVHIDARNCQKSLSKNILNLREILNQITASKAAPKLIITLQGGYEINIDFDPSARAIIGFFRVAQNEYPHIKFFIIDSERQLGGPALARLIALNEQELIVKADGNIFIPRLSSQVTYEEQSNRSTELNLASRQRLETMVWTESVDQYSTEVSSPSYKPALAANDVLVAVTATSLNYRDVLVALGLFDDDLLGHGYSEGALGFEYSGRIIAIGDAVKDLIPGDAVMGFSREGGFKSHLICNAHDLFKVPETLNPILVGGSLVAYATAYYSLITKAQLKAGERVLIHGGAGAVGFAAIQIAKDVGAHVIATARDQDRCTLAQWAGADEVLPSRDIQFYEPIKDSGGVDVVLNSIAGEGMTASLKLMKPFGRFIELGKRDFLDDTPLSLRPFLRNLTYAGVDLDELIKHQRDQLATIVRLLIKGFLKGRYALVPITLYDGRASSEAFQQLRLSKHFGKLAIQPTQKATPRSLITGLPAQVQQFGGGSYIVVGGNRGMGLETAIWLSEHGVRHLIIVSRSGAIAPEDEDRLEALRQSGVTIHCEAVDIADRSALAQKFEAWRARGIPIHGIIHSAVHLEDAVINNLTLEAVERVFASKVVGAQNLHELSRQDPIRHFILYTSSASLVGNPGQGAYVAANSYLEGLACLRRQLGLPALAIGWGAIADKGLLTRDPDLAARIEMVTGIKAMQAREALDWLGRLLNVGSDLGPIQYYSAFRMSAVAEKLAYLQTPIFSGLRRDSTSENRSSEAFLSQLSQLDRDEGIAAIIEACRREIAQILKTPIKTIDPKSALSAYGFDSLMGLELLISIENLLGQTVPMIGIADKSLEAIAISLWEGLQTQSDEGMQNPTGSKAAQAQLEVGRYAGTNNKVKGASDDEDHTLEPSKISSAFQEHTLDEKETIAGTKRSAPFNEAAE